jgi:murein DD-endopeptidase MepM/ murein hydrolase activator NlpD
MRVKFSSPAVLLIGLCMVSALTLGGTPPSSGTRNDINATYLEPSGGQGFGDAVASSVTTSMIFNLPSMVASVVPVPLQIQLLNVSTNTLENGKSLYQLLGEKKSISALAISKNNATSSAQKAQETKPAYLVHTVQSGETLSSIAKQYGITTQTLMNVNTLNSANKLKVGQKLNVITVDGLLYTVKKGESLWDIAKRYKVDINKIVEVNGLSSPEKLQPKQMIVLPGAKPIATATTTSSSSSSAPALVSSKGTLQKAFDWPVQGRISSGFGSRWGTMHYGVDIAVSTGTPVRAAAAGKVTFSGWNGSYGYLVKIDHGNGVETRYAHNSALLVKVGQQVNRGSVIARSGNTGRSTGPHVHFEIRLKGKAYNPLSYLR